MRSVARLAFGLIGLGRIATQRQGQNYAVVYSTVTLNRQFLRLSSQKLFVSFINLRLFKHVTANMPPKRRAPRKVSRKAKAGTSQEDEIQTKTAAKSASKKTKRNVDEEEASNDEPAPKKTKLEQKKAPMNKTESNLSNIDFDCPKLNANGDKFNVKICSWNVSGVRACLKKNGFEYLLKENADIIALQETKCDKDKLPDEIKLPGYHEYFIDSKKSGYCGVALYSKKEPLDIIYGLNIPKHDDEGRMITAEYENFFVVCVYVPNAGKNLVTLPKRLQWNEDFKKFIQKLDAKKPVIVCGDMNVAHNEIDLKNPTTNMKNAGFTKEERQGMTDFLDAGYVDTFRQLYPDKTDAYTFWAYFNNSRSKNIGWRIDYFLVSKTIKDNVCDSVIRDQVFGSDHCPIILYANL
ncbi:exodeoxyribonuclease [Neodiprion virginianus]|uniref:exodeoxyribonuclease n=1 Tax=Neodiprion virginianus TaxID=2961670 RepID=UPI001EE77DF9|nr:exodeoxyribonuclease [Neodiprion virginianus]